MDFLVFGSIWSIIVLFAVIFCSIYYVEDEHNSSGVGVAIVLIAYLVANYFLGNKAMLVDGLVWIKENPFQIIMIVLGYFLLGLFWSIAKWYFYVSSKLERDKEHHEEYHPKEEFKPAKIQFRDNKDLIGMWIGYWPFSVIWNISYRPFKRITIFLRNRFEKTYEAITNSLFNSYTK
jgi:hypothetical protein